MAADGTQIKNDIDTDLANKGYRGVRVANVIFALKKVVDWVTGAVNGNLSTWFKVGTSNSPATNAESVYRTGKVIIGRGTDDGTNSILQVEGYAFLKEGLLATNSDGTNPPARSIGGQAIMALLANWGVPGFSDFAFVNTNPISSGTGFWQMMDGTTRKLLLFLKGGNVGIGTLNPAEALDIVGRVKTTGLVASGNAPTVTIGAGLGTGATAQIIAGSTDQAGKVSMTTGSSATNGNTIYATITFNQAFDVAPRFVFFSARSQEAAREQSKFVALATSPTTLVIFGSNNGNPSTGLSFIFDYLIVK